MTPIKKYFINVSPNGEELLTFDIESGWSVAISDRNEEGHALIAVSYLFFPTKKAPTYIFSTGTDKSINTPSSIISIYNNMGGGIIKFINSNTLILLRGSGFHRLVFSSPFSSTKHDKFTNHYYNYSSIILNQIRTHDIKANFALLNRIIVKDFFFLRKNAKKHHFLEMYNLDPNHGIDFELENILQSPNCSNFPAKTPIITISKNSKLLAVTLCKQAVSIFLIENGLDIAMKKFKNARIIDMTFFDNDNKLAVVTQEEHDTIYTTVWDLFNCNEDDSENIYDDNDNKLRRKQENHNRPIGLFSNFLVYPSLNPGVDLIPFDNNSNDSYYHNGFKPTIICKIVRNMMIITDRKKIRYEIYDLFGKLLDTFDDNDAKQSQEFANLIVEDSEPWDSSSRVQTTIWLNVKKTLQLIIGCQSVQVWEKGKSLLYIWTLPNNYNSNITKIIFEEHQYNSYVLRINSTNTNNNNNDDIEIKLPRSNNYIKEVCRSMKFLNDKHNDAKNLSNRRKRYFEKTIQETIKILKDFIDKHPQKWRLIDTKECIMAHLIVSRCKLVSYILKDKQQYKLHIPRKLGWSEEECQETFIVGTPKKRSSTKKKLNDLHLAILTKNPGIVKELVTYYSALANDNIGWMSTVSEELLFLYRNYKGLFDQPIFGSKEAAHLISGNLRSPSSTAKKFWIKIRNFIRRKCGLKDIPVQMDSISLRTSEKLIIAKPLLDIPTRLTNQVSKHERNERNIDDATPLIMTCMVPLPNFTVPKRDEEASGRSILLRFNRKSRFLRMVLADTNDIIYDNPAMEAIVEFKWNKYAPTDILFYIAMIPSVVIVISMGTVLLVLEIQQCLLLARKYIRLYNLFDVMACVLPMAGTVLILRSLLMSMAQDETTNGFENIPISRPLLIFLSMTILVLWLELIFPFLGVMLLIVCGFAHTMYLLLSRPELIGVAPQGTSFTLRDPSQTLFKNDLVITENVENNYFDDFFSSAKAVYFWTNGQWDQIDHWDFLPVTIITLFASFFLVIVMQNIMIAIMSDVVSDAKYNGKKAFLKLRAELIAEKLINGNQEN
ncbi:4662_t:CDS:2 [Entrophospora sp. SA101]|nr:4662_t:CDS:2 [Entrophospora sp. SA101]